MGSGGTATMPSDMVEGYRRHGLQWPPNIEQIGAAVLYSAEVVAYHSVGARHITPQWCQAVVQGLDAIWTVVVVALYLRTTLCDPTDPGLGRSEAPVTCM